MVIEPRNNTEFKNHFYYILDINIEFFFLIFFRDSKIRESTITLITKKIRKKKWWPGERNRNEWIEQIRKKNTKTNRMMTNITIARSIFLLFLIGCRHAIDVYDEIEYDDGSTRLQLRTSRSVERRQIFCETVSQTEDVFNYNCSNLQLKWVYLKFPTTLIES